MKINGTPRWLYRLRYILWGVWFLQFHSWPVIAAWKACADDFDNTDDERHEGYEPAESVRESLSYWSE